MDRDRRFASGEGSGLTDRPRERFSLAELTEASGVSVRTVRYYIAEGLLPPPVGSGPKAYYTRDHLDRLTLIGHYRANYLPLKEIRRRLEGMSSAEIRREAAEIRGGAVEAARATRTSSPLRDGSGRDEDATGGRPRHRPEEAGEMPAAAPPDAASKSRGSATAAEVEDPDLDADHIGIVSPTSEAIDVRQANKVTDEEATVWRRVRIGPEAELVVSDRLYQRQREAVEQLRKLGKLLFG